MEMDDIVIVRPPPILSLSRPLPEPRQNGKQANINPYQQEDRSDVEIPSPPVEHGSSERILPSIPIEEDMKDRMTESGSSRQRQDSDWSLSSDTQSEDMTKHEDISPGVSTAGQDAPFPPPPPSPPCHSSPEGYRSQIPHPVSMKP